MILPPPPKAFRRASRIAEEVDGETSNAAARSQAKTVPTSLFGGSPLRRLRHGHLKLYTRGNSTNAESSYGVQVSGFGTTAVRVRSNFRGVIAS
jgi:hypothetical protein